MYFPEMNVLGRYYYKQTRHTAMKVLKVTVKSLGLSE